MTNKQTPVNGEDLAKKASEEEVAFDRLVEHKKTNIDSFDLVENNKNVEKHDHRKIQINTEVDMKGMDIVACVNINYLDLIHFFGEPKYKSPTSKESRIMWTFKCKVSGNEAILFDGERYRTIEAVGQWAVGGRGELSMKVVQDAFEEMLRAGKKWVIGKAPDPTVD